MKKVYLGIDPGLAITGYGLILKEDGRLTHLKHGIITTKAAASFFQRIQKVHEELAEIIQKFQPDEVDVEELFFHNNAKTALAVGQVRGVILLTAVQQRKEIREFTPLQVKQSVTGYGRAEKKQVQQMIKLMLRLKDFPKPDDAADALAVAVCASQTLTTEK